MCRRRRRPRMGVNSSITTRPTASNGRQLLRGVSSSCVSNFVRLLVDGVATYNERLCFEELWNLGIEELLVIPKNFPVSQNPTFSFSKIHIFAPSKFFYSKLPHKNFPPFFQSPAKSSSPHF
jgi:hypothetical protein